MRQHIHYANDFAKVSHPLYWLNVIDDRLPLTKIVIASLLLLPVFIFFLLRLVLSFFYFLVSYYFGIGTFLCEKKKEMR